MVLFQGVARVDKLASRMVALSAEPMQAICWDAFTFYQTQG